MSIQASSWLSCTLPFAGRFAVLLVAVLITTLAPALLSFWCVNYCSTLAFQWRSILTVLPNASERRRALWVHQIILILVKKLFLKTYLSGGGSMRNPVSFMFHTWLSKMMFSSSYIFNQIKPSPQCIFIGFLHSAHLYSRLLGVVTMATVELPPPAVAELFSGGTHVHYHCQNHPWMRKNKPSGVCFKNLTSASAQ